MGLTLKNFKLAPFVSADGGPNFLKAARRGVSQEKIEAGKVDLPKSVAQFLKNQDGASLWEITLDKGDRRAWAVTASDSYDQDRVTLFSRRKGREIGALLVTSFDSLDG